MKLTQNSIKDLLNNHKIVLIVISFILGILLNEYLDSPWILVAITGLIGGIISLYFRDLRFLLFIPLGLVFSANSLVVSDSSILDHTGEKIDLEGVLYRSPESRGEGSRLYIDTDYIIREGLPKPVSGKVIIYSSENTSTLVYGDRIRLLDIKLKPIENFKNPGGFNLKKFYERQNIYARGFIDGENSIISFGLSRSYSPILYSIDRMRVKFGNFVRTGFQSPENQILNAITIGDKGGIPLAIRTEFSRSGVAHILAISGLHVGAVAIAFFFLIKWLLKRSEYILLRFQVPRLAAGMTILPIFLYTAIAGFSTSTVRAFIMISLYLLSIVIGKEQYRINTLSAAALIILLWHPWSLFELSFQLSFGAVFAILLTHKFYPFKFATIKDKFYSLIKTTVAATLATFPLIANSFGILPLVSIPANLIMVPLVEFIIVPISLISFLAFLISPYIAGVLISLNIFFIEMLIFGVEMFLQIPYSSLTIPPMNTLSWILFLIIIICLILNSFYPKVKFIIPFIVLGLILSLVNPLPGKSVQGVLEVSFLDVGENKSLVFLQLPNKKNILVNGGYSNTDRNGYLERTVITNYLLKNGIRKIDLLILTSTDKDHLSGAAHLLEKFDVRSLFTNGDKLDGPLWKLINDKNIQWNNISNVKEPITSADINLEILRPQGAFQIEDSSLPYPIAFKLTYGNSSFLFGESLNQAQVQRELIHSFKENIKSRILYIPNIKIGSALFEFIEAVSPEILVTWNTNRSLGVFNQELYSLKEQTIILETDNMGAVTFTTKGEEINGRTFIDEKDIILH